MMIDFSWDASVAGAPQAFKTAMQVAANMLDSQILDPVTVNIQVGYGEDAGSAIPAGALATGGPNSYAGCTYAALAAALAAHAQNGIAANLPATDPTQGAGYWVASQAQARVLGIPDVYATGYDGSVGFSNSVAWNYNASAGMNASQYDFVATALHELTHALGRISNTAYGTYTSLNLYTYSAPGVLQLGSNPPAYFSVDGGNTNLNSFDMSSGGDPADWSSTQTDSFGPGVQGIAAQMSATDWLVMESLGYKIAPTYILTGSSSVNAGAHDYLELSTVNVAAGTRVGYTISGIAASMLDSGSLGGTVTIGADGTAVIDLGIATNAVSTQAVVALGNTSCSVSVSNASDNVIQFTPQVTQISTTAANDTIYGLTEGDVVSYNGNLSEYSIVAPFANTLQVQDHYPGGDGTDTLINVDRLSFQDISVAFDLGTNQSAGETAEMLGAAFGKSAIANASYAGIGIKLFDSGQSMAQVAQLAIGTGQVSAPDNTSFVNSVWLNVVGTPIDPSNLSYYTGLLNSGAFTQATLLAAAALTQANQNHINLVGLAAHGLDYIPS